MDDETARALNAINREFYQQRAESFSATREGAWPGWSQLWELLAREAPGARDVLDVGCGNGRLGRFLAERLPGLRYLGVDASPRMLALARAAGQLGEEPELRQLDFVEDDLAAALAGRRFDLACCFGVLHHVPGAARRERLLRTLVSNLRPGGLLALTSWRLAQLERFRRRVVPWSEWNRSAPHPIDPAALEPGDLLLPWGEGDGMRYVHFADETETPRLLEALGCEPVAHFTADGREGNLNRYAVLRARGGA